MALLGVTGCIRPSRPIPAVPPGEWTGRSGNPAPAPATQETLPAAVHAVWEIGFARGLTAAPVVQDDFVIVTVSGGGIETTAASSARRFWGRRFRGNVVGQPLRVNGRVFFATSHRGGTVYALDLSRGRRLWSRELPGRAAADLVHVRDTLYVSTDRGELIALSATTGNVFWRVRLYQVAAQPLLAAHDDLLIPTTRDSLIRVARSTGAVRAKHPLGGTPSAPLARRGDTLVVALHSGGVAAFTAFGERELWRHSVGAPVLATPVFASDGIYLLNRDAEVYRLSAAGARRIAALGGGATESLTGTADGLLVGRLDGRVIFLRHDGSLVWQERVQGSVRAPVAVHGSSVFVATLAGRLVKLAAAAEAQR